MKIEDLATATELVAEFNELKAKTELLMLPASPDDDDAPQVDVSLILQGVRVPPLSPKETQEIVNVVKTKYMTRLRALQSRLAVLGVEATMPSEAGKNQ